MSLMPNLSNKEIKEAMSNHEDKQTPRFKTFQILSNNIEDFLYSTKKTWGNNL